LIPTPKIEVNNHNSTDRIITALIYSDVQISHEWLNYYPKIYLLRYKSKKSSVKKRNNSFDKLLIPARWAMTTDKIAPNAPFSWDVDSTNVHQNQATLPKHDWAITTNKIAPNARFSWDVDSTNVHQNQATLPKHEFRRNGATQIQLDLNFFFKEIQILNPINLLPTGQTIWVSNQANYGQSGVKTNKLQYISRVNEYFKFVYGIKKDGKIYFGDMSTQTLKTKISNIFGLASVI
jgi:nuclear transport factor 2 (NTF2) superfamily protein